MLRRYAAVRLMPSIHLRYCMPTGKGRNSPNRSKRTVAQTAVVASSRLLIRSRFLIIPTCWNTQLEGKMLTSLPRERRYFGQQLWHAPLYVRTAQYQEEKLRSHRLPLISDEHQLASWLGLSLARLRWFSHDKLDDSVWHYVEFTIPKRNGGKRTILAPKPELKALQRTIQREVINPICNATLLPCVHGFMQGRSIVSNASPHVGRKFVVGLDVEDFFSNIRFASVREQFIDVGYSYSVASVFALLCTERQRKLAFSEGMQTYRAVVGFRHLIQGAPTSPGLSNLVFAHVDQRLLDLAAHHNFEYTRYADDITFSGDNPSALERLVSGCVIELKVNHFTANKQKTRIVRQSSRQHVTGLNVNTKLGVTRATRRRLRAILHNAQFTGLSSQNRDGRANFHAYITGMISMVHSACPDQGIELDTALKRVILPPVPDVGDHVQHSFFGVGVVKSVVKRADSALVEISFNNFGERTLVVPKARLRILRSPF